jgi:pimeloyl-ACP methyl ester carboxylesterase
MPTLERRDAMIHYEVAGSGRPVVFVSGWATGRGCWTPAVERLGRQFRCVTYDPRGVGDSEADETASFELEAHVDDLAALCEAEGIFDAHLVGHELGGRVAAIAARMHPQIAATLTVVGWWGPAEIETALGGFERFRQAASLLLRDLGAFPILRNVVAWSYRRVPEPHRTALFEQFASLDVRAAYLTVLGAADSSANALFEDAVRRLAIPTLLVQGDEDREAARAGLRALFERLSHVDLATVHGAGPLPMLEYPAAFARTLAGFFAEHGPGIKPQLSRNSP